MNFYVITEETPSEIFKSRQRRKIGNIAENNPLKTSQAEREK